MDHSIVYIIICIVVGAAITLYATPHTIRLAYKRQWFDSLGDRKIHSEIVPRIGGIVFVPALLTACAISFMTSIVLNDESIKDEVYDSDQEVLSFGVIAMLIIYIEGIIDDIREVGYKQKFLVHFVCALLVVCSGVWLDNLGGLFGLYRIPWYVGMPFSVLLIMYIINAINLIDGVDGLCAGLAMMDFFFIGLLFFLHQELAETCLAMSMFGTLIVFFAFNVYGSIKKRRKIFMGDSGSQVLGLLLSILALTYAAKAKGDYNSGIAITYAFSMFVIPCLDVIRVMVVRICRGRSPFMPDQSHIHHLLLAKGWSQRKTRNCIFLASTTMTAVNIGLHDKININIISAIDVALYIALIALICLKKSTTPTGR